jgi:hypothetical protein
MTASRVVGSQFTVRGSPFAVKVLLLVLDRAGPRWMVCDWAMEPMESSYAKPTARLALWAIGLMGKAANDKPRTVNGER